MCCKVWTCWAWNKPASATIPLWTCSLQLFANPSMFDFASSTVSASSSFCLLKYCSASTKNVKFSPSTHHISNWSMFTWCFILIYSKDEWLIIQYGGYILWHFLSSQARTEDFLLSICFLARECRPWAWKITTCSDRPYARASRTHGV